MDGMFDLIQPQTAIIHGVGMLPIDMQVMATDGAESPEAQALVSTVDELLASLQRPETPEGRAELRRRLPRLIGRVQQGMALIDLPQQHRNRVLAELMQTHRRHLAEKTEAPAEPAAAPDAGTDPSAPRMPKWIQEGIERFGPIAIFAAFLVSGIGLHLSEDFILIPAGWLAASDWRSMRCA